MKRFLKWLGIIVVVLLVAYVVGPTVKYDAVTKNPITLTTDLTKLEQHIAIDEATAGLKPDNQARIVWADSTHKQKTRYSMVYLPGFGATWAEGDPIHRQLAKRFGCNLYLAREFDHGAKSPDAFKNLTPANYIASTEQALAVGKALGENIILVGTSAGGMLAVYLAAKHPEITSIVLYSPCIAIANPAMKLVTKPWGKQILDQVIGSEYVVISRYKPDRANYWLTRYHTNGLITLQSVLDTYMTPETFAQVKQPVFMGYYFKDEEHQDKVVSVPAMLAMYEKLGTPADKKRKIAFPEAGDHVIASHFTSGDLTGVYKETEKFLQEVVKLQPMIPQTPILALEEKK